MPTGCVDESVINSIINGVCDAPQPVAPTVEPTVASAQYALERVRENNRRGRAIRPQMPMYQEPQYIADAMALGSDGEFIVVTRYDMNRREDKSFTLLEGYGGKAMHINGDSARELYLFLKKYFGGEDSGRTG